MTIQYHYENPLNEPSPLAMLREALFIPSVEIILTEEDTTPKEELRSVYFDETIGSYVADYGIRQEVWRDKDE